MKHLLLLFLVYPIFCSSFLQAQEYIGFAIGIEPSNKEQSLQDLLTDFPQFNLTIGNSYWTNQSIALVHFNEIVSQEKIKQMKQQLYDKEVVLTANEIKIIDGKISAMLPEFYIYLDEAYQIDDLQNLIEKHKVKLKEAYRYMPNVFILTVDKNTGYNCSEMASIFKKHPAVKLTSYNSLFSIDVHSNDPLYAYQWAHKNDGTDLQNNGTEDADMDVEEAWTISMGEPDIKIAIFDSGVDTLHPEFADRLLPGFDAIDNETNGHPNLTLNDNAHGTACAGIVGAAANNEMGMAGIAPNCKIIPVRMFTYLQLGSVVPVSNTQALLDAVNWAAQEANADIVTSSTGLKNADIPLLSIDTVLVNMAIANAANTTRGGKGWITLFSAGNDNSLQIAWPAKLSTTVAVGATDMCDKRKSPSDCSGENWWGSDFGLGLSVSAPGVRIATTDMLPPYGYELQDSFTLTFNGTSAACPNAAGVVALILSVNNELTGAEATHILQASCDKTGGYSYNMDLPSGTWTNQLGYGRVNAFEALQLAQNFSNTHLINNNEFSVSIYPNPMQQQSKIKYKLTTGQKVQIDIYTALGQKVNTLLNTFQTSGEHELILKDKQANGTLLPSGVYFIHFKFDNQNYTHTILVP